MTILLGIHVYFFSVIGMILFPPLRVSSSDLRVFVTILCPSNRKTRPVNGQTKGPSTSLISPMLYSTWSCFSPLRTIPMVIAHLRIHCKAVRLFSDHSCLFEKPSVHYLLCCVPDDRTLLPDDVVHGDQDEHLQGILHGRSRRLLSDDSLGVK